MPTKNFVKVNITFLDSVFRVVKPVTGPEATVFLLLDHNARQVLRFGIIQAAFSCLRIDQLVDLILELEHISTEQLLTTRAADFNLHRRSISEQ